MTAAPNPRHSAASAEWYTPTWLVARSLAVLGGVDLDPASCKEANRVVMARTIFTREDDGLRRPWYAARVFLNPPGCEPGSAATWWFKLAHEVTAGRVLQAIFICFSVELLQVSQNAAPHGLPLPHDFPICFPRSRVKYDQPDPRLGRITGGSPSHASAVFFIPPRAGRAAAVEKFRRCFEDVGRCVNV